MKHDQACNDEKLNLVTSSSSYPSPITMPNRLNLLCRKSQHFIGPIHNQGGLLPGGEQGEEDLQGEIPTHRLREAPTKTTTTIITQIMTNLEKQSSNPDNSSIIHSKSSFVTFQC